jgi:hypothetical protein
VSCPYLRVKGGRDILSEVAYSLILLRQNLRAIYTMVQMKTQTKYQAIRKNSMVQRLFLKKYVVVVAIPWLAYLIFVQAIKK